MIKTESLPTAFAAMAMDFYLPLADKVASWTKFSKGPLVVGINGAQGTGKSTLSKVLALALKHHHHCRSAILSIDDLYHTKSERRQLAKMVHPLLATRGVPGTHDVAMGRHLLDQLKNKQAVSLPVFDKAIDDRAPVDQWVSHPQAVDVILFEGWCVGAVAQHESALARPVNHLEKDEDIDALWRKYANDQLNVAYAGLFKRIDRLVMLKAPDFECVQEWRSTQEDKLRLITDPARSNHALMSQEQLERFIMHYERITRWMLEEMPERSDCVIELNTEHLVTKCRYNENDKA